MPWRWRLYAGHGGGPIWNEGMYSYYAVPQRALFWAMTAWLCLFAVGHGTAAGCAGRGVVLYRLRHL